MIGPIGDVNEKIGIEPTCRKAYPEDDLSGIIRMKYILEAGNNEDKGQLSLFTGHFAGLDFDFNDKLHGRFEVEGRGKSFFGYYHNGQLDAYTLAHASLAYEIGKVNIQAWVRNLFDEDYQVHGLYFANDPRDGFAINRSYYQFGEPRVYGVNVSYSFQSVQQIITSSYWVWPSMTDEEKTNENDSRNKYVSSA